MNQEFSRYLELFDQMAIYTDHWLDRMDPQKMDWTPIENPSMRFGDRVSRITVKGLIIHTIAGERFWLENIRDSDDGATIPIPKRPDLEKLLSGDDFRKVAQSLHEENMNILRAFNSDELEKKLTFVGRQWTGMGLLWGIYAHRAFHLGNIDTYLRQSDRIAPEFFEFPSPVMA